MNNRESELEWYKRNGKHKSRRIKKDANDKYYVIGDWAWNRNTLNKNRQEFIETIFKSQATVESND